MNFTDFRTAQIDEALQWADTVDNIITPDNLVPTSIKDFPNYIEISERLKRICDMMSKELKDKIQEIEDEEMWHIETETYVLRYTSSGMPIMKKRFDTADKRNRELRQRLKNNETYQALTLEQKQWKMMYSDWVSHAKRLHREFRILEINYQSNGGDGIGL